MRWSAPIDVTYHALERSRDYQMNIGGEPAIRAEVREALLSDRVSENCPGWTRGNRLVRHDDSPAKYVWNEEGTRCWVLQLDHGVIVVKTLLLDHDTEQEIRYQHGRVRNGMVRR